MLLKKLVICLSTLVLLFGIGGKGLSAQNYKLTFYASNPTMPGHQGELNWSPGHVWIGVSGDGIQKKAGFYPSGIRNETRRADASYSFIINRYAFYAILSIIDDYNNYDYVIGTRDCRSFARAVAGHAGLYVPSEGINSPARWLVKLVELN